MTAVLAKVKAQLNKLLARKLVVAFVVGFVASFADQITGLAQSQQPLTTSLLEGAAVGALAAAVRGLLAFSPVNIVPSDAATSLTRPRTAVPKHPELSAHGSFAHLKLGRLPVKHDKRTLLLGDYLRPAVKTPASFLTLVKSAIVWPIYGNDRLGDCTLAAVGHMIQAFSFLAGSIKKVSSAAIEKGYWETGTPPSAHGTAGGPTDDGRVELDVLNYMRKTGVSGHTFTAYAEIDTRDHTEAKASVALLGGAYIGLSLPVTAQRQKVWDVVGDGKTGDSAPGSWGGHAVNVIGYDKTGPTIVTWGAPLKMTWAFWDAYVEEAYAIVSPDRVSGALDLAALEADLAKIA